MLDLAYQSNAIRRGDQQDFSWFQFIAATALGGTLNAAFANTCFKGDTPLRTPTGSMRADGIAIGDLLLSQDEFDPNGGIEAKAVEEVFIRVAPILNLHLGGRIIRTTAEHPFYVQDQGWVPAKFLQPGDLLQTEDQQYLPVEGVADSCEVETGYNFRISDYHTYFVGDPTWGLSI
ncbi:MAG: polymorphic toxin-type HINT domain-containing protein [Zavarzinella sp.]